MGAHALTRALVAAIGNRIAIRMRRTRGGVIVDKAPNRHAIRRMAVTMGAAATRIGRPLCGCLHRLVCFGGHASTGNSRRHPVQDQRKHQHQTPCDGPGRHARYFNRTGHEVLSKSLAFEFRTRPPDPAVRRVRDAPCWSVWHLPPARARVYCPPTFIGGRKCLA